MGKIPNNPGPSNRGKHGLKGIKDKDLTPEQRKLKESLKAKKVQPYTTPKSGNSRIDFVEQQSNKFLNAAGNKHTGTAASSFFNENTYTKSNITI